MKLFNILFLINCFLILIGCGGGSSSTDTGGGGTTPPVNETINKIINGTAIDGYIKNATVCLDENENDTCDNGEATVQTNDDGTFTLNVSSKGIKPIIISGGIDTATGAMPST